MTTSEPKLKAECLDFRDGSLRIQIKLFLGDREISTFTVARRDAAETVRQINGL